MIPRYTRPAMGRIWSDENKYRCWLRVEVAGKEVLRGFDLLMRTGEVHVIMGPNGSGKSTLAHALTGHPGYKVLGGSVRIDDVELLTM